MISLNARLKIPIVDQITVVSVFPCQNIIIETLFPVDIINGILYLLLLRQQRTTFLFKDCFFVLELLLHPEGRGQGILSFH